MQMVERYSADAGHEEDGGVPGGYVKEFTRHSSDVLRNLNELRRRDILTDATLVVGTASLQAHCAVLIACSGYFYSLFSRLTLGARERSVSLSLPESLDAGSVSLLLDFMYTSRLPLSARTVPGVLAAATYMQMEHVVDTCRAFMLKSEEITGTPKKSWTLPHLLVLLHPLEERFLTTHQMGIHPYITLPPIWLEELLPTCAVTQQGFPERAGP
ncbi:hypothetical protein ANANG_G00058180 [Anguilla anguilla]|uniref:BTB domain-containing protein n=1 Tax=Anguilla anguilla TaxID=7936 RepID=A0A9D3MQG3_ANGAN|nr:hypothetical protein ANANG_G00058180 [Anguilla anguilla]